MAFLDLDVSGLWILKLAAMTYDVLLLLSD